MNKTDDLHLEEIFLDTPRNDRFLEIRLTKGVFNLSYLVFLLLATIFTVKIGYLNFWEGKFYGDRALANVNKEIYVPAERGYIFARNLEPLAYNEPSFAVALKLSEYFNNREEIDNFLKETIGLDSTSINEAISKSDLEKSDLVIVTKDLTQDDIIKLKGRGIKGLYIEDNFSRVYPYKGEFAHVLGYVDSENSGKTGLELFYDSTLAGVSGAILRKYDAHGKILDYKELRRPIPGANLKTTLDLGLQQYLSDRLFSGLKALGRTGGVGIAVNPKNGEILSLVSLPFFDPNLFVKSGGAAEREKKVEILESKNKPMFNRAISGIYNPGSVIKPLVAVAALSEKVIDVSKNIYSKGYIEIPNPYFPDKPSRFLDWKPHGWVDIYSALAKSSNVYFYAVGGGFPMGVGAAYGGEGIQGLGINLLVKWWKIFGLGLKTGIDLPEEGAGFLPNPEEKERRTGTIWRLGDTYNVSIGQGDLLVTPLQLVNYIAAIANGGKMYKPHLVIEEEPLLLSDLSGFNEEISEVQTGMRDAVRKPYGTAHLLNSLNIESAAKTGTAQIQNNAKTNAFTVAYAPYDNPEIAIIILIEDAKEGSLNSVPIAKDVLNWYYWNRVINGERRGTSENYATSTNQ
ncbi:MAG: hypothetical protein HYT12_04080 [Candidatus Liptonbacteria bacterium]|nr:hypothetical protein [Candidatus Liptonbacteria bacterium]